MDALLLGARFWRLAAERSVQLVWNAEHSLYELDGPSGSCDVEAKVFAKDDDDANYAALEAKMLSCISAVE